MTFMETIMISDNTETNVFDFLILKDETCSVDEDIDKYIYKRGQNFLLNHVNARLDLVII